MIRLLKYISKQTKCNREFLNETELRKIINKDFDIQRLQTVRDIFIFCCFTGLASQT